ncbi:E1-E2 ATPase-domain-containing protein [Phlyctochytrium arcticum]|nr:E1-E2 ATPase-domain-containing protein [Phlyctochytrium arcticum]
MEYFRNLVSGRWKSSLQRLQSGLSSHDLGGPLTVTTTPSPSGGKHLKKSFLPHSTSQLPILASRPILSPDGLGQIQSVFNLEGLTCHSCVNAVETIVKGIKGVEQVVVTLKPNQQAIVVHDGGVVSVQGVTEAIENGGFGVTSTSSERFNASTSQIIGGRTGSMSVASREKGEANYRTTNRKSVRYSQFITSADQFVTHSKQLTSLVASKRRTTFSIHGMTCASCVGSLEAKLKTLPGVETSTVVVTLFPQRAVVTHDTALISTEKLASTIEDAGYDVLATESQSFVVSAVLTTRQDDGIVEILAEHTASTGPTTTYLTITGMTCASCVAAIESTLRKHPAIESVTVNLLTRQGNILHDPVQLGPRDLIALIEQLGFEACLASQNSKLSLVNARDQQERRNYLIQILICAVFAIPTFLISMIFMMALPPGHWLRVKMMDEVRPGLTLSGLILAILATPVQFGLGWRFYRGAWRSLWYAKSANMDVLVALGTSAAYFYSMYDVINAAATKTMGPDGAFFETSILLIFFILVGKYLEAYAKGKTSDAITKLMDLTPPMAVLITTEKGEGGVDKEVEREIEIGLVQVGDVLKVVPGGRIPCDGIILTGSSYVDESMLTGEPLPVPKHPESAVMGGTVNTTSPLVIQATKVGADTALSRIVKLVEDAQTSRAPIQAVADTISRYFVPSVVLLSVINFVIWMALAYANVLPEEWTNGDRTAFALDFAISVLVIACPCSLGLATPTAVMVGTGVGAKYGILIKGGGAALEMAHSVCAIAFDKTGTLTQGFPIVKDNEIYLPSGSNTNVYHQKGDPARHVLSEMDFWVLLHAIESASDHPLAKAVAKHAVDRQSECRKRGILPSTTYEVIDLSEIPGKGLIAVVEAQPQKDEEKGRFAVYVGSYRWMTENGCGVPETSNFDMEQTVNRWSGEGKSCVYLGIGPAPLAEQQQPTSNDLAPPLPHSRRISNDWSSPSRPVSRLFGQRKASLAAAATVPARAPQAGILGILALSDPLRPEATVVVSELARRGIVVWMITGDTRRTAHAIAKLVGIPPSHVLSEVLPEEKAEKIRWLQNTVRSKKRSGRVAMTGDGINDSIALAQADVGIAIGTGSDIALESAQVILMRSNLLDILTLFTLSRATFRRIKLNFVWAFGYNVVGLPIAAGLLYPAGRVGLVPWMAGMAMAASSVCVVLSSLALKLFKPPVV